MMPYCRSVVLAILFVLLTAPAQAQPRVIFDTDIGGDSDDLGALVMLLNLMNRGEVEVLGVMSWSTEQYVVPALDVILRYYGQPDIPFGVRDDEPWHDDWQYNRPIAEAFGSELTVDDVPDALDLYREILANEPDSSVTIVTVGPLANILNLLRSEPDDISPLSGHALVHQKVREFVIMGGGFPEGEDEWNFNGNAPGTTRDVVTALNVPIVFSGWELGYPIRTGPAIRDTDPNTPLYIGYRFFSEHAPWMEERFEGEILDNASYDQTAVLYAVRGGVGEWWELVRGGHVEVDESGDNRWIEGPETNQAYLRLTIEPEEMARIIEGMMLGEF